MGQSKMCSRCKQEQSPDEFPPSKQTKDGLFSYCRACTRAVRRAYVDRNREKVQERARLRYARDESYREGVKARALARYYADPDAGKAKTAEWQRANVERVRQIKLGSERRRYAADPEPRRESWRRRHAMKKKVAVVPFTVEQLRVKMTYWGDRCWVCDGSFDAVDHVKPLAKGGLHVLANLRPICTSCNSCKGARWPSPLSVSN